MTRLDPQKFTEALSEARSELGLAVSFDKSRPIGKRYKVTGKDREYVDPDFESKHPRGTGTQGGQFISKGSSGATVKGVQKDLGIKADGSFGKGTRQAVLEFQRMNGLQVDGIVGAQTASLMMDKPGVAPGALTAENKKFLAGRAGQSTAPIPLSDRPGYRAPKKRKNKKSPGVIFADQRIDERAFALALDVERAELDLATFNKPRTPRNPDDPHPDEGKYLQKGDSGPEVSEIQKKLKIKDTGEYGVKTTHAVRHFQGKNKLTKDGKVGQQTASALLDNKEAHKIKGAPIRPGQRKKLADGAKKRSS